MREFRTYGSVRGALGNGRSYRDQSVFGFRRQRPPAGTGNQDDDAGTEDYSGEGGFAGAG